MITQSPRVCLWPSRSWNPGPGGSFLCLTFPCFLLITGGRLQQKVILSVPMASAYLVLEKHNSSCSSVRIKKPLLVGEGMVRKPPNSLPLLAPCPEVSLQSCRHSHAAASVLSSIPPPPIRGCCGFSNTPSKAWSQPVLGGCSKHSWSSLDSQQSLTETRMKEKAAECSGVIWALKPDKPEFKSQLNSALAVQTWTRHLTSLKFGFLTYKARRLTLQGVWYN